MSTKIRKLTVFDKIAYGSGDMAINISMISASMLIYVFHVQVVGLTPIDAGWILLVVRLVDAFSDPVMGWVTGRVRTRWGRYRHWIGLGAIPLGISLYLMFTTPGGSYEQKLQWAYSTYIFNTLMFTVLTIPYISLVGAITNDPHERLAANTYRFTMAKTATLLVTTFVPYWVVSDADPQAGYATSFIILSAVAVCCLLYCAIGVREQVRVEEKAPPLLAQAKSMLKNDQWMVLCVSIVILLVGFLVRGSIAFIYGTEFAGASEGWSIAMFMGMWSVGGFLAAIISEKLTSHFCKVKVFEYSLYGAAVAGVMSYFMVGQGDLYAAVFFYFICCLLSDINTPILWASITEAADYGEKKTGVDASGLTMGSISLCQKLGMGIAGPITGYTLDFIGYEAGQPLSAATINGLAMAMAFIPALFFTLTGLMMRKYFINNEYYKQMMNRELPAADSMLASPETA